MKEAIVNINKTKNWFFENINKIDKSLVRLIKEKREESNQQNEKLKRKGYSFYEATLTLIPKPDKNATKKKTTGQYH